MIEILPIKMVALGMVYGIELTTHQHLPAAYSAPLVVTARAAGPVAPVGPPRGVGRWPRSAAALDLEALHPSGCSGESGEPPKAWMS